MRPSHTSAPSVSSAYLSHHPPSPFGFSAAWPAQHAWLLECWHRQPKYPFEGSFRKQQKTFSHPLTAASPPPHSLVFLLLLGSPRWLLSFAFALRSPHSALVLQQAFGGILLAALTLTFVELQEALCATIHHPPGYRSTIQRLCLFVPCSADIIIQDRSIATLLSAAAPSPSGCFVTTKPGFSCSLTTTLAFGFRAYTYTRQPRGLIDLGTCPV